MRHGCPQSRGGFLRGCALAACCAMLVVGRGASSSAADAAGDAVSPWATGGAKAKAGDTDGKPGGVKLAQVPVAQAQPLPGYVIQGGAIPKDWQPQAVPYQGVGPDGKPITMYYAPTYTFTYPIGPPVMMSSPVNRRQAYGQPAANGWNYQTRGAAPPTYSLPQPTVARYQPPPYQYPASAPQLAGMPLAPPATSAPQYSPQQSAAPQQSPPSEWQQLQPPPTQWGPSTSATAPPSINSNTGEQMLAAAAPAAMAGAAALATQPSSPPPLTAAVSTAPALQPVMQPVSVSPQSAALAPVQPQPPAGRSANSHLWRVVGVHDGDTITCLDENNQQQKIRMAEMDAPEIGQDFGKVSRDAMAGMVFGKTVEVMDDGKDRYGRWIAHVSVNGMDVNRQMIATGNAWHYAAYSKDQSLADLQTQAQAQKLGLWAQPNPTPPWDYRKTATK